MAIAKDFKRNFTKSSSNSNMLVSVAAAGILGATAALLLAPKAGNKLRKDIYDAGCQAFDQCEENNSKTPLIIGAIAGGLLGASLIYFLSNREEAASNNIGSKIKSVGKTVVNNATDWIETAKDVVDNIHDKVHQFDEEVEEKTEKASTSIDDIMEWAQLGLRVWNNIQKRK